jgi:hypothetical protein
MKELGLLPAMLLLPALAFSQTPVKSQTNSANAPTEIITLSDSAVALTGPWKFQPGDSPWANGAPVWAQPGFDDSQWAATDLTPQAGAVDLMTGTSGYVPGWTRKGYPNLSGYAWYRLRLRVKDAGQPLWLKLPNNFDDAYQVYAKGRFLGQVGDFSRKHVTLYYANTFSFALPASEPDGSFELALRLYMSPATQFSNPDVGGLHGPPVLGLASTVQLLQAAETNANLHVLFGTLLRALLFLLAAPLALWAWLYNRQEHAWLWLFLALVWVVISTFLGALANLTSVLSIAEDTWRAVLVLPLWTMFWWHWFGLREKRWIPRTAWLLAAIIVLLQFCARSPYVGLTIVPQFALHWFNTASVWVMVPYQLLGIVILVEGFRRDRAEALLAALPIVLGMYGAFGSYLLTTFDIPNHFFPFGLGIGITDVIAMLMVLVVGALALRRFMRTQVRESLTRQAAKKDMEQAQQLQQRVLVPEILDSPAYTVETEYCPAQTVGGDFFQTLSKPDGSLLVVIGDVSGKGVSAAMLVAVLVGAIRSQAEHSFDPALMLATLNRRMIGRSGGNFATCVVAVLNSSGEMKIANAGHLPPYLNSMEINIEGSLPLGVADDAEYGAQTIALKPGDKLMFMTDGVVEATNLAKELFGFDRARAISGQNAAAIVAHVQKFGQEDDITVLGVQFAAA